MSLTVQDLEKFQSGYPDYQMELVDEKIIVIGPSDAISSEISARLITFLNIWVIPRNLGRLLDSSGGFVLPNTDLRAPDVSFVRAERLKRSPRTFAELLPDVMVEIKSKTDRIKPIQGKIQTFLQLGTQVGILIDPDKLTVTVYHLTGKTVVLGNGDTLTIPELLSGWELAVSDLWPPVFE